MSFGDIYSAPPGSSVGSNAPGLPPVNLPEGQPLRRQPLKVTVRPETREPEISPWAAQQKRSGEEPLEPEPDVSPWAASQPESSKENTEQIKQANEISRTEAAERGLGAGISFGGAPALEGLAAASLQPAPEGPTERASGHAAYRPIQGLINLLRERDQGVTGLIAGPGPATQAYRKARDEAQAKLEASREQHPLATFGGEVAGSILAPAPGTAKLAQGASLPTRLVRGAVTGGTAGALYGTGTAISKGEDLDQALEEILASGATGSLFGSAFHGAVGPRAPRGNTPGHIAQGVGEQLGARLPRGLTSDNPVIQATTAKARSIPLVGTGISGRVNNFQNAVGENVAGMARSTSGGIMPNRDLVGGNIREALGGRNRPPGRPSVLDRNHQAIDDAYNQLRNVSQTHLFASRNHTEAAIDQIIRSRHGARSANPLAGLDDAINILRGGGIAFIGLQRARSILSEKLAFPSQHPGFNTMDGRRLRDAMTRDMEEAVTRHARPGVTRQQALDALNNAHRTAADYINRNNTIQKLLNLPSNEGLIGSLMAAAQSRGNRQLLRQLRRSMDPQEFEQIGGMIMAELGRTGNGDFSLIKMINGWNQIQGSAPELFSPQHLDALNNILTAGRHIRGALSESNVGKSETAGVIILFDLAKDIVLFTAAAGAGTLGAGAIAGGIAGTAVGAFSYWLSRPAAAQSMSRWVTAYRALTLGVPTPARRAAFNIATRNLANTLGVPIEQILKRVAQENGAGAATPQRQALPAR